MASLERPWPAMRTDEIFRAVKAGKRPPAPKQCCPGGWRRLVMRCWSHNPLKRPSVPEICEELARMHCDVAAVEHASDAEWSCLEGRSGPGEV